MSRNLTFPSGAPGSGPPCLKTRRSDPFRIPRPDRIPLHGEPSPLFFPKNRFLPHPPCRERPCRGALPLGAPPFLGAPLLVPLRIEAGRFPSNGKPRGQEPGANEGGADTRYGDRASCRGSSSDSAPWIPADRGGGGAGRAGGGRGGGGSRAAR